LALSQPLICFAVGRRPEQVAQLQLAMPAPETVEALLFLVEFGRRELLLCELAIELAFVLGAFADELQPLFLAGRCELRFEPSSLKGVATARGEEQHFSVAALDELERPLQSLGERRGVGQRPHPLAEQKRAGTPKLSPHSDAMTRRLRWNTHREHSPAQVLRPFRRHNSDCSVGYRAKAEQVSARNSQL